MSDTRDGGYILDDSGLKPYSADDDDEEYSKGRYLHASFVRPGGLR